MADIKFTCPHCKQDIQCDELWCGHNIQCPICKNEMTVPHAQAAPPADAAPSIATAAERNNPLVPKPPAASKLSAGRTQVARSSTPTGVPQRQFQTSARKGPSAAVRYAIIGITVAVIGGGGYFGWTYYQAYTARKEEEARQIEAAKRAAEKAARDKAEAEARAARTPKDLPVVAPAYTLDPAKAQIAESKVNGSIAGTAFVSEIARIGHSGATHVLTFCQGPVTSPDREIGIVLRLGGMEDPSNQHIEVTPDNKSPLVTQIIKLAKADPRYAAKTEKFSTGYLLKLDLGQMANGMLPGKIYLALPGDDQTVVAGMFVASLIVPNPNAAAATPQPVQPVQVANPSAKAAMDRRYGKKR